MTYCIGIAVDEGLVFASDSRTNAGIDIVNSYPKCFRYAWPGNRAIVILSAGSLATTQVVIKQIESDLNLPVVEGKKAPESLLTCQRMMDVADYIGRASAAIQQRQGDTAQGVDLAASFIVGGQLPGEDPEMYMVYPQGNYITYSPNQPFLQLGETKYGKPILDRIITPATHLADATRCALVSMDSTLRSNASVGLPIDLAVYRSGSFRLEQALTFTEDDEFFRELRGAWSTGLMEAFMKLPHFDWEHPAPQQAAYESNVRPMPSQR